MVESDAESIVTAYLDALEGRDFERLRSYLSDTGFSYRSPVSAADIERLIGDVESDLQAMGEIEVSSRVVGDMVIDGLKEMDLVAYVRYAIVYLRLEDLNAIRGEIDALLEG